MRWKQWVVFGAIQCVGFMLLVIDVGPCGGSGVIALLPGSLILFNLPPGVHRLPPWAGYLVAGGFVVCANALVWCWAVKVRRNFNTPN